MAFDAPAGTEHVRTLGTGTVFEVALVRDGEALLVCKRLTSRTRNEPSARAAMIREAKALALVQHPALPTVVRVGSDASGPFLLETHADGVSLRALVDAWAELGERVPTRLVGHVARAATRALAEIAERQDTAGPLGIVHGDLAPDHVLFGPSGQVRFVDFGAARWRGMDEALRTDDRGTLPYVAPEVARGEAPPSASSDVYSLAATLLFLASGNPPCEARDPAAMLVEVGERGIRGDRLDGAASLTEKERAALRTALAPDPCDRSSARALLGALGP